MENDSIQLILDMLRRWHIWSSPIGEELGYPTRAAGCDMWRCSRQYDDSNGALDSDLHQVQMEAVEFAVSCIADPWKSALYQVARNEAMPHGGKVFRHPRLPADDKARAVIVSEALQMLSVRIAIPIDETEIRGVV